MIPHTQFPEAVAKFIFNGGIITHLPDQPTCRETPFADFLGALVIHGLGAGSGFSEDEENRMAELADKEARRKESHDHMRL